MQSDAYQLIDAGALQALVTAIFERCGMEDSDAGVLARSLVDADLGGVHSHGVLRVPEYVAKLTQGGVNPRGTPAIVQDNGACLVVDGDNSMGVIGAQFAMRAAIDRATTLGLAAVAIRGSNHCGALAFIARQALDHEMIGIATTNALPTMAPWGGTERLLGINPLAVAIPAATSCPSCTMQPLAAPRMARSGCTTIRDDRIPEGWALDSQGHPTTDAASALAGLLLPIGGFKGSGLAMIMGILSSMLSGAAYGTELGSMETGPQPGRDGHFVAALRVGAFVDSAAVQARVDGAIRQIHGCRLAPGVHASTPRARKNCAHRRPIAVRASRSTRRHRAGIWLTRHGAWASPQRRSIAWAVCDGQRDPRRARGLWVGGSEPCPIIPAAGRGGELGGGYRRERANALAGTQGATRVTTDYHMALDDPAVDAVDICLPHNLHAAVAVAAAQAGKHILCEKPMAGTLDEADRMIAAAQAAGVILMIAENVHFDPLVRKVRALLDAGAIGRPALIQMTRECYLNRSFLEERRWFLDRHAAAGGIMMSGGIHDFETMRMLLGEMSR